MNNFTVTKTICGRTQYKTIYTSFDKAKANIIALIKNCLGEDITEDETNLLSIQDFNKNWSFTVDSIKFTLVEKEV